MKLEFIEIEMSDHLTFNKAKKSNQSTFYIYVEMRSSYEIGIIKWWTNWRRYVFVPRGDVVIDGECLQEINEYIKQLMKERKDNV